MTPHDWIHLFLRWVHFIAGIAWIGSSFYFIWLDRNLEPRPDQERVEGALWMVHSGGFYQVERRRIGPGQMPATLHWFKWEAAFTWLSGAGLLGLLYYATGGLYLVDPGVARVPPATAALISAGVLVGGWVVYDLIWKWAVGRREGLALVVSLALLAAVAFGFCRILSGRAAFLHVGALMGTIMVANVWMRILPGQQRMIDATKRGEEPDLRNAEAAKVRSVHNSYMTFPVLFLMLSNHFPGVYGGERNWAALGLLTVLGVAARHLMIGHGRARWWAAAPIGLALVGLVMLAPPARMSAASAGATPVRASSGDPPSFARVQAIVLARCTACHSATPRLDAFGAAPGGVNFDDPREIARWANRIELRTVHTRTMPLGNMTLMTDAERAELARWLDAGAPER
jgi:uncharacterized membrane protein